MAKSRFTLIESARWDVPRNQMIRPETPEIEAENRRMVLPSYFVLVQHPALGNVMYDTGVASDYADFWGEEMLEQYEFLSLNNFNDKLAELGLTPADIDILIISHLHYDHEGNIRRFAHTKAGQNILVSRAEYEAANDLCADADMNGAYYAPEFKDIDGLNFKLLENEDVELAEGLKLFFLPGHTSGLMAMMVETESGNYLFPSDACYSSYHMGPPIVYPGLCADPVSYKACIERLQDIAKEYNAEVFFSHDIEEFEKRKKSPEFYE